MAQVPTVTAPTVTPSGAPTSVSTPSSAFGASVLGAGLDEAGKALGVESDTLARHAEVQATLNASAAANSLAVAVSQKQDDLAIKFRTDNPGMKAEGALPGLYSDLDTVRQQARASLNSPIAQKMFDDQTRLQQEKLQVNNAVWASGEVKQSRVNSWKAYLDNQSRGATLATIDDQAKSIEPTLRAWGVQEGWTDEQMTAAKSAWIGNTAYSLITGSAGKDPQGAQAALAKYGQYMNPQERGVLQNQLQASLDAHTVAGIADKAFTQSLNSGPGGGPPIARFVTPEAGLAAADENLAAYGSKHGINTLAGVINRWAPPNENNTAAYIATVAKATGIDPNAHIDLANAQTRHTILTAMAQVEGGKNNNPLNLRSAGFKGEVGPTPTQQLDLAEQNAPQTLATIAADPALRGDPILINNAQRQYLTNLSQAREVQNMATKSSFDRLYTTMIENNIQDVGKLQGSYPQASADWASLSEAAKQQLQRQAGAAANMWTPERGSNWQQLYGKAINDPQSFSQIDLTKTDLTKANRDSLYEMQQHIIAKKNSPTAQANVTSALSLEPIKQALANRPDLKPDTPAYDQFTGAFAERMQEFMDEHGGKIGAGDKAKIAVGLLGSQPAHYEIAGFIPGAATTVPSFQIPAESATRIRQQIEPGLGRSLTDYEIGQIYAKAHSGGR